MNGAAVFVGQLFLCFGGTLTLCGLGLTLLKMRGAVSVAQYGLLLLASGGLGRWMAGDHSWPVTLAWGIGGVLAVVAAFFLLGGGDGDLKREARER